MLTARPDRPPASALGVGEVNVQGRVRCSPARPNPNRGLSAVRRPGRHRRPGLRLGQLGEHGHGERLLEPASWNSVLGERDLGLRVLEPGQLGERLLEPGELVLGLLERCQLGSRFLGRSELERGSWAAASWAP